MGSFSVFQLISLSCVGLFLIGVLNIYFSDRNNYCQMTYMFEYPQFVRIRVPENQIYPQYGLYAYSEGKLTERARKMRFDGIPVLFLPGNSGSHMQVRSLSSVALRKALSYEYENHFDFFTVSYNEELSSLYGGVLEKQLDFATMCHETILNLYNANSLKRPKSVVIIGHSMGGVIAKALLTHPKTSNSTNLVLTLAAPLSSPVVNVDQKINEFYLRLSDEWSNTKRIDPTLIDSKVLLSFGSGPKDVLVPSNLIGSQQSDLSVLTTAVPGVWISTDHVSIVWCKQFVMVVNKFLFSLIDYRSGQIVTDKSVIMKNAHRYFKANRSERFVSNDERPWVPMQRDAFWYEDNRRIYQITRPEITKTSYIMLRLVSFAQNRFAAVEMVNVDDKEWLYGCNAMHITGSMRYCKEAVSLADLSRWSPSAGANYGRRKVATLPLHEIMEQEPDWTHIIVKVSPTRKATTVNVDINDGASRELSVSLPYLFSPSKHIVKYETETDALYYQIRMANFDLLYQSYLLYVEPTDNCKVNYHVTAEFSTPWSDLNHFTHFFTPQHKSPMRLRLSAANTNITDSEDGYARVTLLLDPQCTYTISISSSLYDTLGQLVRFYAVVLFPYMAGVILLAARCNITSLQKSGYCNSMYAALCCESVKPYFVIVGARLFGIALISIPLLAYIFETASSIQGNTFNYGGSLLSIPIYMTALGVIHIIVVAFICVMVFASQLVHRLVWRLVWNGGSIFGERLSAMLSSVSVVGAVALTFIVWGSTGALALATGTALYSLILARKYEEYLEELGYKLVAKFIWRLLSRFRFSKREFQQEEQINQLIPVQEKNGTKDEQLNEQLKELDHKEMNKAGPSETKSEVVALQDKLELESGSESDSDSLVKVENVDENDTPSEKDDQIDDLMNEENVNNVVEAVNESLVNGMENETVYDEELSGINFHTMMFFMWTMVAVINIPVLLTWSKNFKHGIILSPDTAYYPGFVMSICAGFLWQMKTPRPYLEHYEQMKHILFMLAVMVITLGPLAIYYINYTLMAAFALITLQQLFDRELPTPRCSPNETLNEDDESEHSGNSVFNSFKDVKEKTEFANLDPVM